MDNVVFHGPLPPQSPVHIISPLMLCFMANIQWNDVGWQCWAMQCTQPSSLVHCLHSIISDSSVLQGRQTFIIVYCTLKVHVNLFIYQSINLSIHQLDCLMISQSLACNCSASLSCGNLRDTLVKWYVEDVNRNSNSNGRYLKRNLKKSRVVCHMYCMYWHDT